MQKKTLIGLDVDGGDLGHDVTMPAAIKALKVYQDLHIKLFGDAEKIQSNLKKTSIPKENYQIIHAEEKIRSNDAPIAAMRKKQSSMYLAFDALCDQKIQSMVSAGSTSALVILASKIKIENVSRVGIMASLPKVNDGVTYIVDCGASLNSTKENLVEFAKMGHIFLQQNSVEKNPKIGLLNVGEEETKGTNIIQETNSELSKMDINYIGYVEPFDFYTDKVDLIIANGFEGNVMLKSVQATFQFLLALNKKSAITQLSKPYWLYINHLKKKYWNKGGYLLGAKRNIIKAHGSSSSSSVFSAIKDAREYAISQVEQKIEASMAEK